MALSRRPGSRSISPWSAVNRISVPALASLDTAALLHTGAIRFVEGPGEVNHNPFTDQGKFDEASAIAF
jgi:hypothetical protein